MHRVQDAAVPRVGAAAGGGIEPVLSAATPADHELLGRLWQLYLHDLSGVPRLALRHYRRSGLGRRTALEVLRGRPGRWEIAFQGENPAAARFWRQIAAEVAGGDWTEQRRPVPDKPHLPPDVWLTLDVR